MASFSRAFVFRPQSEETSPTPTTEAVDLQSLLGEVRDMDPTWAKGSSIFHTKARCSRYAEIDGKNLRSQAAEPSGKTLCDTCRKISLLGRKG